MVGCSTLQTWIRFNVGSLLLLLVLACGNLSLRLARADETGEPTKTGKPSSNVRLIVDYGDGVQKHFTQIPWKSGLTVWNALQTAEKHPRGLTVKSKGEEDTLLITEIDGLANQGGVSSRNWIFRVNGELGEQSAGITEVMAGDRIEWRFERFSESP